MGNLTVEFTKNYGAFKRLDGNRMVSRARVDKIKKSIQKVGYVTNPIVVNEKMEVIDGQGRLQALMEMDIPVAYIVVNGIGIEECRAMNERQTNWQTVDFIDSYAESGIWSYTVLRDAYLKHERLGLNVVISSFTGLMRSISQDVRSGEFTTDVDTAKKASERLDYFEKLEDVLHKCGGAKYLFYNVVGLLMDMDGWDNDRFLAKLTVCKNELKIGRAPLDIVMEVERIYNYKVRGEQTYFVDAYKKVMDEHARRFRNAR